MAVLAHRQLKKINTTLNNELRFWGDFLNRLRVCVNFFTESGCSSSSSDSSRLRALDSRARFPSTALSMSGGTRAYHVLFPALSIGDEGIDDLELPALRIGASSESSESMTRVFRFLWVLSKIRMHKISDVGRNAR